MIVDVVSSCWEEDATGGLGSCEGVQAWLKEPLLLLSELSGYEEHKHCK